MSATQIAPFPGWPDEKVWAIPCPARGCEGLRWVGTHPWMREQGYTVCNVRTCSIKKLTELPDAARAALENHL